MFSKKWDYLWLKDWACQFYTTILSTHPVHTSRVCLWGYCVEGQCRRPCWSHCMRPQLEYYIKIWDPQHKKDLYLLEPVQRKPGRWSERAGVPLLWGQADRVALLCPEKCRFQGDLIGAFKYIKEPTGKLKRDSLQGFVMTGQGEMDLSWKRADLD